MVHHTAVAIASAALLLLAAGAPVPARAAHGAHAGAAMIQIRQACDADGRCYETGDPGYRDDDAPPPRHFDPDDEDRPPPRRYHRDDDN